jgi:ZIP family zinc transporter
MDARDVGARAAAIAAGGLLAMLTDSLIPFAYDKGGIGAGFATVVGFVAALAIT